MAVDQDTKIKVLNTEGVAACVDKTDEGGGLHVHLLADTPKVQSAVLQIIGSQLTLEQVVFESRKSIIQCTFCGKSRTEVRKLVESPTAMIQGQEVPIPVRICDECIMRCVAMI